MHALASQLLWGDTHVCKKLFFNAKGGFMVANVISYTAAYSIVSSVSVAVLSPPCMLLNYIKQVSSPAAVNS